jgi:short subunit dehydrogenase-like uncharacterized protein
MASSENQTERQFDVVVWGASGFTGRLVAEYLMSRYGAGADLRWAMAGRDREKLEAVRSGLHSESGTPPIIIADSFDGDALCGLARDTRVVLSTVGPYARYGTMLVEACVQNGTHYCDLAGEVQWMRKMIDRYQTDAADSGARIVHSCGFDSIPSDIGVWYLQREARRHYGEACVEIRLRVKAINGGASGGTYASMMNAIEESRCDRTIAEILLDPYSLNPAGERSGPDGSDQAGIEFHTENTGWTAPFIMAAVNSRVVRRTNALLGYPYGREFRYRESTLTGHGSGGWLKSAAITAGLGGFMLLCSFESGRSFLTGRVLPKPGEGPNSEQRESGFFKLLLVGKLPDGAAIRASVTGDRDPGYGSTSKMLGESAVCLARDKLATGGGFWTPASAMGDALLHRLVENAGLSFELL